MKMAILELEYKNIRKITALKLPFTKADGSVISNNFIMMANGTGKTTTMELIKGLFDGTAAGWTASKVRSFAPTLTEADTGEFSITVKFDDRQYKYFLSMNYKDGTVQVETSAPPKGREAGLRLPESIRGIFTPEFVRRFVFDGEQAAKSMDSSSNEADETIRYLYRLDELDEILAANQRILTEIQNAEGKRGTSSSLSNLRTRQSDIDAIRAKLRARCEKLREEIAAFEAEKVEKEKQRQELDKSYEKLNQEKNDILKEQQKNRGEIDVKITSILGIIKSPYLLSESLCARMFELGNSMKKLKLPKTIAKDFFTELASADRCVCDRCIGERERTAIVDDYVEIESIDRYIKLKGRDGASEGQTLSIAYCFLGTLFEDSELEFPFIIDSPTGKMDFEKRQAVADIIPLVFNQMIAFVQSAEVERFADRFYANPDSQYLTVVASPQDQAVVVYEGIDFFDSYQREHKGDEK